MAIIRIESFLSVLILRIYYYHSSFWDTPMIWQSLLLANLKLRVLGRLVQLDEKSIKGRIKKKIGQCKGHHYTMTKTSHNEISISSKGNLPLLLFVLLFSWCPFSVFFPFLSSFRFAESCSFWRLVWKFSRFPGLRAHGEGFRVLAGLRQSGTGGDEWLANSGPYLALCFTFQLQMSYLCVSDGSCQRNQDCKTEENTTLLHKLQSKYTLRKSVSRPNIKKRSAWTSDFISIV